MGSRRVGHDLATKPHHTESPLDDVPYIPYAVLIQISCCPSDWINSSVLSYSSQMLYSTSSSQLLNPMIEFFSSFIIFVISVIYVWYFLTYSASVDILIFVMHFFLLTSVSNFMIVILNFLACKLLIAISLNSVSGVLYCPFIWNIFLYLHFSLLSVLISAH